MKAPYVDYILNNFKNSVYLRGDYIEMIKYNLNYASKHLEEWKSSLSYIIKNEGKNTWTTSFLNAAGYTNESLLRIITDLVFMINYLKNKFSNLDIIYFNDNAEMVRQFLSIFPQPPTFPNSGIDSNSNINTDQEEGRWRKTMPYINPQTGEREEMGESFRVEPIGYSNISINIAKLINVVNTIIIFIHHLVGHLTELVSYYNGNIGSVTRKAINLTKPGTIPTTKNIIN